MASPWRSAAMNLGERVDLDLLSTVYAQASLSTQEIRDQLREADLSYFKPGTASPPLEDLNDSARQLIDASARKATLRGALTGSLGALTVAPEVVAGLVQQLHLAQRLAVVYGHDPETDRGRIFLQRALAEAFGMSLPKQGEVGMKVSDLPKVIAEQLPSPRQTTVWLTRTMAARTMRRLVTRFGRLIPGFGIGYGAIDARRSIRKRGEMVAASLARNWSGLPRLDQPIEDAIEIPPPDTVDSASTPR